MTLFLLHGLGSAWQERQPFTAHKSDGFPADHAQSCRFPGSGFGQDRLDYRVNGVSILDLAGPLDTLAASRMAGPHGQEFACYEVRSSA